jgi:hypothetical protein
MVPREFAEKFPVVMLYDRLASVDQAMDTYSHLTRELQDEFNPDLRMWRIDVAGSAEFSAQAGEDIAAAEVIIMTVRGDQPCPAAFLDWKGGADRAGRAPPHAVIALVESKDTQPAPNAETWGSFLRGSATEIHPEVFVYDSADELAADDARRHALA